MGAEEVFVERSNYFQLLDPKDSIIEEHGLSLVTSVPKGSSPVGERLDPSCSKPRKCNG